MNQLNLEQILSHPIVGNAYSDMPLMDSIHHYVHCTTNTMNNKIKVLKKLDEVMGMPSEELTEKDVVDYIAMGS